MNSTDVRGEQLPYAKAVHRWFTFHGNLTPSSSNRVGVKNRKVFLRSHLYHRVGDFCEGVEVDIFAAGNGTELTIEAIYKRHSL